jgi:hypothetical protein
MNSQHPYFDRITVIATASPLKIIAHHCSTENGKPVVTSGRFYSWRGALLRSKPQHIVDQPETFELFAPESSRKAA